MEKYLGLIIVVVVAIFGLSLVFAVSSPTGMAVKEESESGWVNFFRALVQVAEEEEAKEKEMLKKIERPSNDFEYPEETYDEEYTCDSCTAIDEVTALRDQYENELSRLETRISQLEQRRLSCHERTPSQGQTCNDACNFVSRICMGSVVTVESGVLSSLTKFSSCSVTPGGRDGNYNLNGYISCICC